MTGGLESNCFVEILGNIFEDMDLAAADELFLRSHLGNLSASHFLYKMPKPKLMNC